MKHFLLLFSLMPVLVMADDAEYNPVAAKIKQQLEKQVQRHFTSYQGFCDVTLYMNHGHRYATIEKVLTRGDDKVCQYIIKKISKKKKYRFEVLEKMITVHISS